MGTWGDKSGVNSLDAVVDGRLRARPTRLKNMAKAARDAGMPQKRNCRPVVSWHDAKEHWQRRRSIAF